MKKIAADRNYRIAQQAAESKGSNPNEDECTNALRTYLSNAKKHIFDMWNEGEYERNCKGTSLEQWHYDLIAFISAVGHGRAQLPKRLGSTRQ